MTTEDKKLCEICGLKLAEYVCRICGRRVCRDDYDVEKGVCSICRDTMCEICGRYPAISYCMVCGRIGCEDCLIQVTPVSYVCKECVRRGLYRLELRRR